MTLKANTSNKKDSDFNTNLTRLLVCPISGEVMSEENPPMVLPNGLVYSLKALQRLADASPSGVVTCPRTLERYTYSSARKAFLM